MNIDATKIIAIATGMAALAAQYGFVTLPEQRRADVNRDANYTARDRIADLKSDIKNVREDLKFAREQLNETNEDLDYWRDLYQDHLREENEAPH